MEGIKKHTFFCRITDGAVKKIRKFRNNTKGVTTVEVILVLVGIFTPYYGVGIRCMA